MPYTTFTLPSGATVFVQSSKEPEPRELGTVQASAIDARAREAWSNGAGLVAEVGAGLIDQLRSAFRDVDEVEVEFGANISGKMTVVVVEGTAEANLKITVRWKAPASANA